MTDDNAATTDAVIETIEHVLRLHRKVETLQASLGDSLKVAASLAGEMGAAMDYATFYRLAMELRDNDVPGRGVFTGGRQLPPPPGTVIRRNRNENDPPWPGYCPCVYILINASGEVIYVGKTTHLPSRITAHRAKPWEWCEAVVCESEQAALDLEGDLIFQHQPDLNRAGRWERPGTSAASGDPDELVRQDEYQNAQRCADEWRRWTFDGTPAPLPGMRELEQSLDRWIYGHRMRLPDLLDLIPIALDRNGVKFEDRWRYYCGVAWNHAREATD